MLSIQLKKVASHCAGTKTVLLLAHRRDGGLRQRLGVDIPLIGEIRLQHRTGPVAVRHDVRRGLDLLKKAARLELFVDKLAERGAFTALDNVDCLQQIGF